MSGKCYNEGGRGSIWANEWNHDSSAVLRDADSVYDAQSQISDAAADELNHTGISDVKERMRKLFETQCYTDVTFYPKDNRRMSISAHRAVLAIGSPLFTKMLFSEQSIHSAGMKMEVQISNLSFDAFTNIVKYMYTDEVFFENDTLVQGILEGAKQFGIHSLVSRCKQYFETMELTEENVCSKLQMSISNKIDVLKERCIEFIQKNTFQVINSSEFQKCSPTTVRAICRLQSLNLKTEMEFLEAVMRWLYAQPVQNRKKMLEPLLKCVRFLTFTVTELGDTLKKYTDLMTSNEGLSIMLYLYNPPKTPDYSNLPSWCNKNTASRCFFKEDVYSSRMRLNVNDPKSALTGKVFFPLKSDPGQTAIIELTSLLQLKCISGFHLIKAIRLTFERPMSDQSVIGSLCIKVHVHPSDFRTSENVQIVNSESVRVEFKRVIKARRGDLVDIEAEARNIRRYRFLQFDETGPMPVNPHFNSCVSSRPKHGKLYFINEIEYGPQEKAFNVRGGPQLNRKKK